MIPSAKGYADEAKDLIGYYENIPFADKHRATLHLIPSQPSRVVDIGAGTGADAAWFADKGHRVVAVEPTKELRLPGMALHAASRIEWLDDSLPDLAVTTRREDKFDLVMMTAVWMHLDEQERNIAMPKVAGLLAPGGVVIMTLRHGPRPPGRRMFEVSAEDTIALAKIHGMKAILSTRAGSVQAINRQAGVTWSCLALKKGESPGMSQHIGIVACSAEGASLCYRTICAEGARLMGAHAHPEVSMHTHPLADYTKCLDRGDMNGVGDLMLSSARKLASIGADFLVCPDNTIHQAFDYVEARSPKPWLHIAEVVAGEAVARGFRRLGLSGTRWLADSDVYPAKLSLHGIEWIRPSASERDEIHRIIMDELVYGIFKPEGIAYFQQVYARMKNEGCDAVILGCTEIPLIMSDSNSPLPTLDSTRLLARAALRRAV